MCFLICLVLTPTLGGRLYEPVLTFCIRSQSILCKQLTRLHLITALFFQMGFLWIFFLSKNHGVEVGDLPTEPPRSLSTRVLESDPTAMKPIIDLVKRRVSGSSVERPVFLLVLGGGME